MIDFFPTFSVSFQNFSLNFRKLAAVRLFHYKVLRIANLLVKKFSKSENFCGDPTGCANFWKDERCGMYQIFGHMAEWIVVCTWWVQNPREVEGSKPVGAPNYF